MSEIPQIEETVRQRREWMAVLAKASTETIEPLWDALSDKPRWTCIRPPEVGMVMVRARAGGTGQRFNMGEMTVTRCVVRLDDGEVASKVGHAYVAGRDTRHAELAAVVDAMMQQPERRDALRRALIAPLANAQAEARDRTRRRTAATKVDFFTMVRGD
jgi:alpha-D-ribose 1-methylphosphonate 5-triphosphate synthase subunit PhnG